MRSTDFSDVFKVATAGMRVQGERLRIIAENIANAESTGLSPGAEPYRRRQIQFKEVLDNTSGLSTVKIAAVTGDTTPFTREYNPAHPAADAEGYVLMPNVKPLVESIDMKEAQRSYEANLSVIDTIKSMLARALDVLRG